MPNLGYITFKKITDRDSQKCGTGTEKKDTTRNNLENIQRKLFEYSLGAMN